MQLFWGWTSRGLSCGSLLLWFNSKRDLCSQPDKLEIRIDRKKIDLPWSHSKITACQLQDGHASPKQSFFFSQQVALSRDFVNNAVFNITCDLSDDNSTFLTSRQSRPTLIAWTWTCYIISIQFLLVLMVLFMTAVSTISKTVDKMCSCIADIYLWADFHIGNVVQFCSKISEITVSLGAFLVFYGSGSMTKSIL